MTDDFVSLLRAIFRQTACGRGLMLLMTVPGLAACEQERDPCLQPTTVYLRARSMQHVSDTTVRDSLLPAPRWTAIDSAATLIFANRSSVFSLPLNPRADSCRFAVQPDSAAASFDTLVFYYEKRLQFLSNACGYTYFYTLQGVNTTLHGVDSVKIINGDVNSNVNTPEHIQVFF